MDIKKLIFFYFFSCFFRYFFQNFSFFLNCVYTLQHFFEFFNKKLAETIIDKRAIEEKKRAKIEEIEKLYDMPIWEGDKIFFRLIEEKVPLSLLDKS